MNKNKIIGCSIILIILIIIIFIVVKSNNKSTDNNVKDENIVYSGDDVTVRFNDSSLMYEYYDNDGKLLYTSGSSSDYEYVVENPDLVNDLPNRQENMENNYLESDEAN